MEIDIEISRPVKLCLRRSDFFNNNIISPTSMDVMTFDNHFTILRYLAYDIGQANFV